MKRLAIYIYIYIPSLRISARRLDDETALTKEIQLERI